MKKLIKILAVALALSIVVGILCIGCAPQAMPAKLMALYGEPTDPEAFLNHYREVHIPLANQLPDVRNFIISKGTVAAAEGESPYFFIAEVEWDDMDSLQNALASPEMEACAADLPNFATGGVTILIYEYEEVK